MENKKVSNKKNEIRVGLQDFSAEVLTSVGTMVSDLEIKLKEKIEDEYFIKKIMPEILEHLADIQTKYTWERLLNEHYDQNEYHKVARSWTTGKKHIEHHNSYYPTQTLTASLYDVWLAQNGQEEQVDVQKFHESVE